MSKKIIASLLALLMLVACLASCGTPADTTVGGNDTTAAPNPEDTTPEEEVVVRPDIPQEDNGGEEFYILYPENASTYKSYLFAPDELDGDNVNMAMFERNMAVSEWLGVTITSNCLGSYKNIYGELQKTVMADTDTYDLVVTHSGDNIVNMVAGKYVQDWNAIESVDLTSALWNQSSVDLFERNGVVPLAINDFIIPSVNLILFNIDLMDEYGIPLPYDTVLAGEWTLDTFFELASRVHKDDGDGVKNLTDTFGFVTTFDHRVTSFQHGVGQMIIEKDSDGEYAYVQYSDKMVNFVEKFNSFLQGESGFGGPAAKPIFSEGRSVFYVEQLVSTIEMRALELNFGVLPMPKWDVSQEDYISVCWVGYMGVPTTVRNTELVGKVSTLLAYENNQRVLPEFYDILLGNKLANDLQCQQMVEIIFENCIFDLGITMDRRAFFQELISTGSNDVASKWEGVESSYQGALDAFVAAYDEYLNK